MPREGLLRLLDRWQARGLAQSDEIVEGGYRLARVDDPGRIHLYANQQGGFKVCCPVNGAPLARPFGAALEAWRRGAPRMLACPACGANHPLEEVELQPPGGFARGAVVLADVGGPELSTLGRLELVALLGPGLRVIPARVG